MIPLFNNTVSSSDYTVQRLAKKCCYYSKTYSSCPYEKP